MYRRTAYYTDNNNKINAEYIVPVTVAKVPAAGNIYHTVALFNLFSVRNTQEKCNAKSSPNLDPNPNPKTNPNPNFKNSVEK